jgi:hypothetical protein
MVINNNLLTGMHPSNAANPIKQHTTLPHFAMLGGAFKTMLFHVIPLHLLRKDVNKKQHFHRMVSCGKP